MVKLLVRSGHSLARLWCSSGVLQGCASRPHGGSMHILLHIIAQSVPASGFLLLCWAADLALVGCQPSLLQLCVTIIHTTACRL